MQLDEDELRETIMGYVQPGVKVVKDDLAFHVSVTVNLNCSLEL